MRFIGLTAIVILVISFVFISSFTNADKPSLPSDEIITLNIRADNLKAEVETLITVHKVLQCESGYQHIWSKVDFNPPTFGVAQFKRSTFEELAGKADMDLDFYSMQDQIDLLIWSIENGYGDRWSCFNKLKRKGLV